MTDFEGQVLTDLGVLKSQMEQVMGIGQPGRLHLLESRVSASEEGIQKMKGFAAAFGTALTIVHLAISYFAIKHN
jgi:hypothetical protein